MAPYSIEELKNIITPIAIHHGVSSVSIFGSYSRGTATADSDLDLKIEKGNLLSLYQLSAFRLEIEDALDLSVDLVTSEASDKNFLDIIAKEEVLLYRTLQRYPCAKNCL